ncbi:3-keto-5-aminohexanoate cleavage protein [Streptomyces sp. NPDC090085]|uniref:3-keto-5-aminohexanoate cleavage protein n=1 Tax=Streptomyces sp. NPDC090085 TaxID=3365943 RepID=UPI0037F5E8C3
MRPLPVVSLNGSRGAADGPAVPMSPEDLARSAAEAVAAGAGEVLVHPRTPCGRESLSPRVVGPVLRALRDAGVAVPLAVPVSVATEPDPAGRVARVRSWTVLPDRAVVRWAEPGAAELVRALLLRGIAVDAALPAAEADGTAPWGRELPGEVRPVLELTGRGAAAGEPTWGGARGPGPAGTRQATRGAGRGGTREAAPGPGRAGAREAARGPGWAGAREAARGPGWAGAREPAQVGVREPAPEAAVPRIGDGDGGPPGWLREQPAAGWVLFGRDAAAWPAARLAVRWGAVVRTGVGDVLRLPDGRPARSNAELVAAAREIERAESRGGPTAASR